MNPGEAPPGAAVPHGRRWRRVVVAVVVFVVVAMALPMWLLRSRPSYWHVLDRSDPQVVRAAEEVESRITSETTSVRPEDQPWTLELTDEQINAWLAARLPLWLANQNVNAKIRDAIPHVVAHISLGRIEGAALLRGGGFDQIVRLLYRPKTGEAGSPARLELEGVYAGRVRVPLSLMVEQVSERLGGNARDAAEAVRAMQSIELFLKLDDGRRVRVTGLDLTEGKAVLTCRTVGRRGRAAIRNGVRNRGSRGGI